MTPTYITFSHTSLGPVRRSVFVELDFVDQYEPALPKSARLSHDTCRQDLPNDMPCDVTEGYVDF